MTIKNAGNYVWAGNYLYIVFLMIVSIPPWVTLTPHSKDQSAYSYDATMMAVM